MTRVALVHDWLTGFRGGERVLLSLCRMYPEATLFTLVHRPGSQPPEIERMAIRTSFIQRLPLAARLYRHYLPLHPAAIEALDLRGFDLVISSSHCVAKGVIAPPSALHLCYCHTPMRYIWDMYQDYFGPGRAGPLTRLVVPLAASRLRLWDQVSSARVDHFLANSRHVAQRIAARYRRAATVIHPPVDVLRFTPPEGAGEAGGAPSGAPYYLMVSALSPYKQVDLAIEAFNRAGKELRIIGFGPQERRLRRRAGPTIRFLGVVPLEEMVRQLRGCRALVFPGEEDFGLAPVEAQACGRPVVAYGRGGALESVLDGRTGIFFDEQRPEALQAAIDKLEGAELNSREIRQNALRFSEEAFRTKFGRFVAEKLAGGKPQRESD